MILDEIIEAKLVEKFSQEEIKSFYETFVKNFKSFEKLNEQTVDTLFEFKEFSQFKKKMLTYKRGMDDGTLKKAAVEETDTLPLQQMVGGDHEALKKIFYDLAAEDVADASFKWKKTLDMEEKDGIKCTVYTRPIQGRRVNMCKNVSVFRGVSIKAWLEFSLNFLKYMGDDPEFKQQNQAVNVIEESPDKMHAIYLSRSKFGPMASDRESLVQSDYIKLEDKKYLLVARSIELDKYPADPAVVRLEYFRCQEVKEVDGDLYTTGFSNIDFKGYFPASLMNMILSNMIQGGKKNSYKVYQKIQAKVDAGEI